ncbi:Porin domain, Gram-negative type [Candidatus Pelagibacterales bacterium]
MTKKLLATSALFSTLALASTSFAQTTITGSLDLTLRNTSHSASAGAASETTMGRESQINIANKGKLNNGLDYAAGFSLEFDGQNAGSTADSSLSNEAVYLNLISGGTTFHVGVDWIQNGKQDLLGAVGDIIDEVGASTVSGTKLTYVGSSPKESIGAGIVQNFGNGITASALYVPNDTNTGTGNNGTSTISTTGTNSAYEIGIRGVNVANSGISFDVWRNDKESVTPASTTVRDTEGTAFAINYSKAPFSAGVASLKTETAVVGTDVKTKMGHLSYAIDKNLTASVVYAKTDDTLAANNADEKIKSLMLGYNFGPVGLLVTASKIENLGAISTGGDVDAVGISLNTKF